MFNFVISGTSGIGKTYLEEQLEKTERFYQLPKYTTRPIRKSENPDKLVHLETSEFLSLKNHGQFFFTLNYAGYSYGWQKQDLLLHPQKSKTLAITLDSLKPFLAQNPNFIPVLLTINPNNFTLLKSRIIQREGDPNIAASRLKLAADETSSIHKYTSAVKDYKGHIFTIKDNGTIPSLIIPKLISLFRL